MTLFRAPERDAEAYQESAAFSEPDSLTASNKMLWASTLAHELFHAWNGHVIRPSNYSELQWVSEGFTDYYASRSLARARVIDEAVFVRKLEHTIGLYLFFKAAPVFDSVTVVSAGERKGRNRLGVYNGGWVTAFCIDTEIRTRSAGAKSLDDVMRVLHTRFGLTGRPYSLADLRSTLAEISGAHFDDFLTRYVAGNETIPIVECLKRAGYEGGGAGYDGDYYITRSANSSYRRWLFGARSGGM
jgi:predicted metalloprotease with PDZ domain